MRSRLIKIGNSKGVRLPKTLLDQTGIDGEVEIKAEGAALRITCVRRSKHPRDGWEETFIATARKGQKNTPLDPPTPTRFDEEEWEWS